MSTEKLKERPAPKPPEEPRAGYKGGLFDHIDVPAITSFIVCLLLFILLLVGIRSIDYSSLNKPSLEDLSDRVSKIIMPLKPPGKAPPKPEAPKGGPARGRIAPVGTAGDASASARIERSRHTVSRQIVKVQERITKAAVLSILSGKGPGTAGTGVGRQGRRGGDGFAGFGDLDARMGSLEGLTKYDGKKGEFNQDGAPPPRSKGEEIAATSGIDKMVKGFQNAKSSALSKIGIAETEKTEQMDRSAKFTGNRSPNEVAAFINKKQSMVSMLYEERLKSNPALEGKVTVIMVIEEDGTVSDASILRSETTLDDPEFTAELLRRIKRWIFPPSGGGPVEMKSPFVFRPA
ncbi:MAG TPA: AgmX/PglI C-terminal domain-containing protein [Fibrobacteria bacterium]|nr:AgmX/PglI C-terminal domain-containing protein [Fibrobacteria bacterium]